MQSNVIVKLYRKPDFSAWLAVLLPAAIVLFVCTYLPMRVKVNIPSHTPKQFLMVKIYLNIIMWIFFLAFSLFLPRLRPLWQITYDESHMYTFYFFTATGFWPLFCPVLRLVRLRLFFRIKIASIALRVWPNEPTDSVIVYYCLLHEP